MVLSIPSLSSLSHYLTIKADYMYILWLHYETLFLVIFLAASGAQGVVSMSVSSVLRKEHLLFIFLALIFQYSLSSLSSFDFIRQMEPETLCLVIFLSLQGATLTPGLMELYAPM